MKWNIKWFIWLAIIANMADLITAYFILDGESNPLFIWLGSYWFLAVFKIAFCGLLLYWGNKERTEHNHYYFTMALVWCIFLFSFGAWSNIQGIMNPTMIEAAAQIPNAVKINYYFNIISILAILPMILNIVTFEIFYRTRKVRHQIEVKING